MGEIIQINRTEIMAGEAWERHQRILKLRDDAMSSWWGLAEELYLFYTKKEYEQLGYETYEDYLEDPEVDIGKTMGYVLKQSYEKMIIQLAFRPAEMIGVNLSKLEKLLPHITEENKIELLAQARTLKRYDLRKWLKEKFRPPKTDLPTELDQSIYQGDAWQIIHGDMREICAEFPDKSFDAIVTDPPYPSEFLPLFEELARVANRLLVPSGTMLVMSGQAHLPEVLRLMTKHITYRWTIAYLTPGKETRIWGRQIWAHWKPVLVFSKDGLIGDWAVDVVTSPAPDKEYHYWGQSLQGMRGLIDSFVLPNSRILDPFCGGGATIEAALDLGHECVGIDNDAEAILAIQERLNDKARKNRLA